MPRTDQITISFVDIDNLIQVIERHKPSGGVITIVDNGTCWTIRDLDGMHISSFTKANANEQAS